jgi:DNA-directed RNA polymerase omega subunit
MPYSSLEEKALDKIGNRYSLVMLIAKRINQLKKGAKPRVRIKNGESFYIIAVKEMAAGKIVPVLVGTPLKPEKIAAKQKPESACPSCSQKKPIGKRCKEISIIKQT